MGQKKPVPIFSRRLASSYKKQHTGFSRALRCVCPASCSQRGGVRRFASRFWKLLRQRFSPQSAGGAAFSSRRSSLALGAKRTPPPSLGRLAGMTRKRIGELYRTETCAVVMQCSRLAKTKRHRGVFLHIGGILTFVALSTARTYMLVDVCLLSAKNQQ